MIKGLFRKFSMCYYPEDTLPTPAGWLVLFEILAGIASHGKYWMRWLLQDMMCEKDPFNTKLTITLPARERSPYVNRLRLMWLQMRSIIIPHFPPAPGMPSDKEAYLKTVDNLYVNDAYHSLSIERYRVSRGTY